ncbi:uncharacterized protein (DUF1684 family) [Rhizobium sp. BK313]|uniref:hypothetical protein n=1 Tax=Rhizobium sp. BK313 TaxID=2587081 RepID=UPI0017FE4F5D|nr:hypothetical protein [Rhizobium sp. BK313]MBB3454375.1 uncharacterized protein (DUF1684 family) [Rhizobium sp. BK313]
MIETQQLWEWREKIANLYYEVRSSPDVVAAWGLWCDTRSTLFRDHPQSPIEPVDRKTFEGPTTFPYDPSLRLAVQLVPVTPERVAITGISISLLKRARTSGAMSVRRAMKRSRRG